MSKLIKKLLKNWQLLVVMFFCLTPVMWFVNYGQNGKIINGVDTNFPLNPLVWFIRRFYDWNNISNAGIDNASNLSGLFFHLTQVIPYLLGFNLQHVQIISFVFWFSLITIASFWLAKTLFKGKPLVQVLFVCLYVFNIFAFNAWENSKVSTLSLLAGLPIFLNIVTLYYEKAISLQKTILFSSLAALVASGIGVNPAYFISLILTILIYYLGLVLADLKKESIVWVSKGVLIILACLILASSFWLIPTASYVTKNIASSGSIDKIGFTNWVDSLSENTSLLNVMRVQGLWDWYAFDAVTGNPLYIPYALNYFKRIPFVAFSFLIPSLALLSYIFFDKRKKNLYISFGIMTLLGAFLGAGTHLPTGAIFRVLLTKIPFFSLFRSPWYIFTPLIITAYAGLVSLLFYELKPSRRLITLTVTILVVGNLLYTYPLVSGKIFRPAKKDGFFVEFPSYVLDFKEKLKEFPSDKRIIGYPDDEIEQFTWGYRGIESILTLFSDKEVVFSPLNNLNTPVSKIIGLLFNDLKKGEIKAVYALADKLNIGSIFEKKDQNSLSLKLSTVLRVQPELNNGPWSLYPLGDQETKKIFLASDLYFAYPYTDNPKSLSLTGYQDVVLNSEDSVIAKVPQIAKNSGQILTTENSQANDFHNMQYSDSKLANRLISRDASFVEYSFKTQSEGSYSGILERYRLEDFGLGAETIEAFLDKNPITINILNKDDSFVYFAPIFLTAGEHILRINLVNPDLVDSFKQNGKANLQLLGDEPDSYLSIINTDINDSSAVFDIPNFDPLAAYLVQVEYKQIYGNNALVLVTQETKETLVKTQSERLPNYPEWRAFSFFYEPVKTDSSASVLLVAPQTKDPLGTKIFYNNLKVNKVFTNDLYFVSKKQSNQVGEISFVKKSPVSYKGAVKKEGPSIIVFSENYSPDWKIKAPGKTIHFSANLYANAWYIEGAPESYEFEIYYEPQRLLILGFIISAGTIVGSIFYLQRKRKV